MKTKAERQVDYMIAMVKAGGDYAQQRNSIIHQLNLHRSTDIPAQTELSEAKAAWLLETYRNAWIDWMSADTEGDSAIFYRRYLDIQKRIIALMSEALEQAA